MLPKPNPIQKIYGRVVLGSLFNKVVSIDKFTTRTIWLSRKIVSTRPNSTHEHS